MVCALRPVAGGRLCSLRPARLPEGGKTATAELQQRARVTVSCLAAPPQLGHPLAGLRSPRDHSRATAMAPRIDRSTCPLGAAAPDPRQEPTARRSGGRRAPSRAPPSGRQVLAVGPADRDDAAVAVPVLGLAGHRAVADLVVEDLGHPLAAAVGRAPRVGAVLAPSGASMPNRRMRWPRISIVSPSITLARPTMGVSGSRAVADDYATMTARAPR